MKIALKGMPRRTFLYALGLVLLMLFTFRWRAFWWPFIHRPKKGTLLPSRPNPFVEGKKTLVSIVHGRDVETMVRKAIAELNLAYTPDLNIVDGTRLMVEGGPWEGKAVDANLIIATGDRIAADLVGLGILKHYSSLPQIKEVDVWEQKQVKRAMELGLGIKRGDEIELLEEDLEPRIPGFRGVMETVRKAIWGEEVE